MSTIHNDLKLLIQEIKPKTLLIIGPVNAALDTENTQCTRIPTFSSLSELKDLGRFDLVIVLDALIELDKKQGEHLLGSLRNLHAKRLLLSHTPCSKWLLQDFLAFALSELNRYPADADSPEQQLFEYNIFSYKSVPDWLNNKFWANPNMWDKGRW